jgi:hypothetical protein
VLRFLLGIGGAVLVFWVLSSHTDELSGAESIFDHLRWAWLVPALLVEAGSYVSLALVQRRLLATGGVDASLRTLTGITLASQAMINSVPAGSALAAVYGFRWFRRLGANDSLAVWALIGTVVVGVITLALVAAGGLALATGYGASLDLVPVTVGVLLVSVAVGALFLYQRPQRAVAMWAVRASRRLTGRPLGDAEARVASFLVQVTAFKPSKRVVASVLGWGVGNWVFDCACFAFCFLAVGAGIPWKGLLLSYGAGQLAANLPITREPGEHRRGGVDLPVTQLLGRTGGRMGGRRVAGARSSIRPMAAPRAVHSLAGRWIDARRGGDRWQRCSSGGAVMGVGASVVRSGRSRGGRRWRCWLGASALVIGLGSAAGCSTVHESLGTSDSPCYVALPTATAAVGVAGHFDGVRLMTVSSLKFPRLQTALKRAGIVSGRVCLVAFKGNFTSTTVSHPSGRASGHLAVVVLRYPNGSLVATVLFRKLPTKFGHSHLG